MLTREQILGAGFRSEVVSTRIGDMRVRVMSGAARELFEASLKDGDTSGTIRARWLRLTVCDDAGNLLFTDADIPELARLDADVLIPPFAAALRINLQTTPWLSGDLSIDGPHTRLWLKSPCRDRCQQGDACSKKRCHGVPGFEHRVLVSE